MGCLLVLALGGVSAAMLFFFGYPDWVLIVLGLLWLAALAVSFVLGHHGFGTGTNTDLQIVIAGLFVTAAIILPNYTTQKHCDQAKAALGQLAEAEKGYFAVHKTYAGLDALELKLDPNIQVTMPKADQRSFVASASHRSCIKDGAPVVFTWDSSTGGLQ